MPLRATREEHIVFDYAYDRFHADRYGKDFLHVRLDGHVDATDVAAKATLSAALLAYWWQRRSFDDASVQAALRDKQLQVADPLWLLLGLHVIGGKGNAGDREQTADVVGVLQWLHGILSDPSQLVGGLNTVKQLASHLGGSFPSAALQSLCGDIEALAVTILTSVFGWTQGDKPLIRSLGSSSGELRTRSAPRWHRALLRRDCVGDVAGLRKALEEIGLDVSTDALTPSLFARLDQDGSGLNLLIGSRRFASWDNYRASSMTLLRLGQSEDL